MRLEISAPLCLKRLAFFPFKLPKRGADISERVVSIARLCRRASEWALLAATWRGRRWRRGAHDRASPNFMGLTSLG